MTETLHLTDHALKIAIDDELKWTPGVIADEIGVAINRGAVTLSGRVATYPEKESAVRAVLGVRGVRALVDEVSVESKSRLPEDADIARDAASALETSVVVPDSVRVVVQDGLLSLSGAVEWRYQSVAAARAVRSLPGVVRVRNEIAIEPSAVLIPDAAKLAIAAALVRTAGLDADHVAVEVSGTTVTLSGTVPTWAAVRQAERAAWSAPGVGHVENALTVVS